MHRRHRECEASWTFTQRIKYFPVKRVRFANEVVWPIAVNKGIPNLILLTLNSLANCSSSRISGESMSIGSSTSLLFLLSSCLNSEAVGSSARRGWCRGGKPWLRVWSGNLYRQGVKPPAGKERAKDCWWLCLVLYKQHSVRP